VPGSFVVAVELDRPLESLPRLIQRTRLPQRQAQVIAHLTRVRDQPSRFPQLGDRDLGLSPIERRRPGSVMARA
jgi:hypothetical protein